MSPSAARMRSNSSSVGKSSPASMRAYHSASMSTSAANATGLSIPCAARSSARRLGYVVVTVIDARMRRGSSGRKCGAGYDLALMATTTRTTVELERPGGRADVLIVRRITTGRPAPIHGPGARHWTMHYTLTGEREFTMRARAVMAEADTLLVYRREDASGTPPRPSARWDAMSACFETGTAAWVPPAGFERIARDVYRARVPLPATRQRIRAAFARLMEDDQVRIASRTVGTVGAGRLAPAAASEDALRRELMLLTLREILLLAGTGRGDAARLDTRVRDALETMSRDTTGRHTLASLGAE